MIEKKVVAAMALFLMCSFAQGQDQPKPATVGDTWRVKVVPYVWVPQISGHATADVGGLGVRTPVDASFNEVVDELNYEAAGRVEAWKGNLGVFVDALFVGVGDDTHVLDRVDAHTNIKLAYVELGMGYRVLNTALGNDETHLLTVEVMGGGRYMYANVEVRNAPLPNPEYSKSWVDPFVGGRVRVGINERLAMSCRANAGGFGIGSCSKSVYDALVAVEYQLSERTTVEAGYRWMDIDKHFDRAGNGLRNQLDVRLDGPYIGLGFLF